MIGLASRVWPVSSNQVAVAIIGRACHCLPIELQAQEVQSARAKILQASGLAPAQAIAPTVASVGSALQQAAAAQQQQAAPSQAAPQQASQAQAAGTPSGLNPISSLISQAGGLLQSYLPNLGRRLLRE